MAEGADKNKSAKGLRGKASEGGRNPGKFRKVS
jgi:hypothetical protein